MFSRRKRNRRPSAHPNRIGGKSLPVANGKGRIETLPPVSSERERGGIVGTLSFPVKSDGSPKGDNSETIAKVVLRRKPGLLLCGGCSVLSQGNLPSIVSAAKRVGAVVVVETNDEPRTSFRIQDGKLFEIGEQFFGCRRDTNADSPGALDKLAGALAQRSFTLRGRPVVLLVCGEVTVMQGRKKVGFHPSAPQKLRDALQAEGLVILNPTHTRMGNSGVIKAWRRFLSKRGRVYVSASNRGPHQRWSSTIQSLWNNGECKTPLFSDESDLFCYREWSLPR